MQRTQRTLINLVDGRSGDRALNSLVTALSVELGSLPLTYRLAMASISTSISPVYHRHYCTQLQRWSDHAKRTGKHDLRVIMFSIRFRVLFSKACPSREKVCRHRNYSTFLACSSHLTYSFSLLLALTCDGCFDRAANGSRVGFPERGVPITATL